MRSSRGGRSPETQQGGLGVMTQRDPGEREPGAPGGTRTRILAALAAATAVLIGAVATVYALGGDGGGGGFVGIRPTAEPDSLTVQSVDPVTFSAVKFTTNDKDPAGKGLTLVGADRTSATRGMVAFATVELRITPRAASRARTLSPTPSATQTAALTSGQRRLQLRPRGPAVATL